MANYQVWIAALTSTVGLLVAIKGLFGNTINTWVEGRKESKREELVIKKELADMKVNFGQITEILQNLETKIGEGHELDILYLEDRDLLHSVLNRNDLQDVQIAAIKQGVLAITRDRIIFLMKQFLSAGSISIADYENLQCMYEAYKELGGNHVVDTLMVDIERLPKKH